MGDSSMNEMADPAMNSGSTPQSTDEQRDLVEKWIHGCGAAYGVGGEEWKAFVAAVANDVAGMLSKRGATAAAYCQLYQSEADKVAELTRERNQLLDALERLQNCLGGDVETDDEADLALLRRAVTHARTVLARVQEAGRPVAQDEEPTI